ncbi:hypothetical protein ACE41H_24050 [Paenibacillus enshidis]|uniref:Guanylate cyclase domain-containing protein n=1 Tax=Paenibacillus enshidis TaxID=1458439 RepID=A0ABV5B347_9BACL
MKYEERIIAFIDILGFKNLVNNDLMCEDIGAILKLPYVLRQGDMLKRLKITGMMMTSISDSLVFSIGLKERGAMNKITKLLSVFSQTLLAQYSLLLRGGIAVGKIYHDNDIVYGPGLVKAYELESKIAIFPRIVIERSDFESSILSCSTPSQLTLRKEYVSGDDCILMLDCFHYTSQEKLKLCRFKLEQIEASDLRVQQKINWMITMISTKLKEKAINL